MLPLDLTRRITAISMQPHVDEHEDEGEKDGDAGDSEADSPRAASSG
jgi:hypothetical protein